MSEIGVGEADHRRTPGRRQAGPRWRGSLPGTRRPVSHRVERQTARRDRSRSPSLRSGSWFSDGGSTSHSTHVCPRVTSFSSYLLDIVSKKCGSARAKSIKGTSKTRDAGVGLPGVRPSTGSRPVARDDPHGRPSGGSTWPVEEGEDGVERGRCRRCLAWNSAEARRSGRYTSGVRTRMVNAGGQGSSRRRGGAARGGTATRAVPHRGQGSRGPGRRAMPTRACRGGPSQLGRPGSVIVQDPGREPVEVGESQATSTIGAGAARTKSGAGSGRCKPSRAFEATAGCGLAAVTRYRPPRSFLARHHAPVPPRTAVGPRPSTAAPTGLVGVRAGRGPARRTPDAPGDLGPPSPFRRALPGVRLVDHPVAVA